MEQCGLAEALEHDGAAGVGGVWRLGPATVVWRHRSGDVGVEIMSNPGA